LAAQMIRSLSSWLLAKRFLPQFLHECRSTNGPYSDQSCSIRSDHLYLHVSSAVMFGRGRLQNDVIIEPKEEYAVDPTDEGEVGEFRNFIW